jgi:hypothetical protein
METNPRVILETWRDRDTVVQICNTLELARRIRDAAHAMKPKVYNLHVGPVTYDKDEGSRCSYYWGAFIFQKNIRFNEQKEFLFALISDSNMQNEPHVVLRLGNCNDLLRIL